MSTMKKLFALVLALAMMMSVAVFANAYGDTDTIDEDCFDAVAELTALGLIKGDNHGNFNPENTITRAEAAKIIYVLRNGGIDDNAASWVGAEPFADVADSDWYAGYVAWCYNFGIIDGVSATAFNPRQPIKGTELAKMLLTTAGYRSAIEGYTGADWEKNVIEDAQSAGLFDGYKLGYVKPCARQWAALMISNALNVKEAQYLGDYRLPSSDGAKLTDKYLKVTKSVEMIVIANDVWSVVNGGFVKDTEGKVMGNLKLTRAAYENERVLAEEGNILLASMDSIKAYKAGTMKAEDFYKGVVELAMNESDKEASIVGQNALYIAKSNGSEGYCILGDGVSGKLTITKNDKGLYTVNVGAVKYIDAKEGTTVLADGIYDAQLSNIWLSDTNSIPTKAGKAVYAASDEENLIDLEIFYEGVATVAGYYNTVYNLNREAEFTAYDFDGDKVIDAVISNAPVYARANSAAGQMHFGICNDAAIWNGNSWTSVVIDDFGVGNFEVGAIYKLSYDYTTGLRTSTKVDTVVGKVNGFVRNTSGAIEKIVIDGVEYTIFNKGIRQYGAVTTGSLHRTNSDDTWAAMLGKLVSYSVDSKGNLVHALAYSTGSSGGSVAATYSNSNLAYFIEKKTIKVDVTTVDPVWGEEKTEEVPVVKVKVMFTDGTTKTFTYDDESKVSGAAKSSALVAGKVYEFVENDGVIVFKTNLTKFSNVAYGNKDANTAVAAGSLVNEVAYSLEKNRFGNVLVDDNTVIFVHYTAKVDGVDTDIYTVMKISEFKKLIDGVKFNLIVRNSSTISTALVASVDFGTKGLPADPDAPEAPAESYLLLVTGKAIEWNFGEDVEGNLINVAKFKAIDLTTGVEGDYFLKDMKKSVTVGAIISGEFNKDGFIEADSKTITPAAFNNALTASSYFKGAVKEKAGELLLVKDTLLDKSMLAKDCVVLMRDGSKFTVSNYDAITKAATTSSTSTTLKNNIMFRTNAKGEIDLIIFGKSGDKALASF